MITCWPRYPWIQFVRWEHWIYRWMEAYRSGLSTTDAQLQVRQFSSTKYKSHRRVPEMVARALTDIGRVLYIVANLDLDKKFFSLSFALIKIPSWGFVLIAKNEAFLW